MLEIISVEETETMIITKAKTSKGVLVTLKEPKHTPEEQNKIWDDFVDACARMLYPAEVVDNSKTITLTA